LVETDDGVERSVKLGSGSREAGSSDALRFDGFAYRAILSAD
jgi:hypothetical protein